MLSFFLGGHFNVFAIETVELKLNKGLPPYFQWKNVQFSKGTYTFTFSVTQIY